MQKMWKKKNLILLTVLIIVLTVIEIVLTSQRTRIFYDEMLTFQRASEMFNSDSRIDWEDFDDYLNEIHTGAEFTDNFSVYPSNSITNAALSKIIHHFIIARQYNVLLSIVGTIHGSGFCIMDAVVLNGILYALTLLVIAAIARRAFKNSYMPYLAVALCGLCRGVMTTFGYYRFYALYVFCMMVVLYCYVRFLTEELSLKNRIIIIFISLVATWVGYSNSEYALIYAAFLLLVYLVIEASHKRWKIVGITLVPYILGALVVLIKQFDFIINEIKNGTTDTTNASQVKIAYENFMSRGIKSTLVETQNFVLNIWAKVNKTDLILWIPIILVAIYLMIVKKDKARKKIEILCLFVIPNVLYVLAISKVCPWSTWRYETQIFPCIVLTLIAILDFSLIKESYKAYLSVALVAVTIITIVVRGNTIVLDLDDTGPSIEDKEYIEENFSDVDGIYFYDGDDGTAYYGAFLWPQNSATYCTSIEDFSEDTSDKLDIVDNDEILVWISYSQLDDTEAIFDSLSQYGYSDFIQVLDSDENYGRHRVYLASK